MSRDKQPGEIELVNTDFSTKARQEASMEIDEKWNSQMSFKELAADGDYSRSHYSNCYYDYFGIVDDPNDRTLQEIKDEYGSITAYYEKRRHVEKSPTESKVLEQYGQGYQDGFKDGYERGIEAGRESTA